MTEIVSYDVDADGICLLSMDLPGKTINTMSNALTLALCACIERALADDDVKGVVLASGKAGFLAGGDLKDLNKGFDFAGLSLGEIAERLGMLSVFLRKVETSGKPFACAINGTALGGGFELALSCHYRVCSDDPAILLGLPEANVGLLPGAGGTQRLLRLIGVIRAAPLLLQGSMLSPAAALETGMIDKIVPLDDLLIEAKRWLRETPNAVQPWDVAGFEIPGGGTMLAANFRDFFRTGNALIRAGSYGNYPALEAISSAVYEGAQLPMDVALRIETKHFTRLLTGPVSKNLIRTMFVSKGKADRLESRPNVAPRLRYHRIAVIGAGAAGAGIALVAARARIYVDLFDADRAAAARGKEFVAGRLQKDVGQGRLTQTMADEILGRIHLATDYALLGEAQLAIETISEVSAVRRETIAELARYLTEDTVLASNSPMISGLEGYAQAPERFIGLHFLPPAERTPLVEIIRGQMTSAATLAKSLDFVQAIRKTPITVKDGGASFILRLTGAFTAESRRMIEQGVKPALVQNAALMLGMKSGALTLPDPIADQGLPLALPQPEVGQVKNRILYAQLCEAARCFAEDMLADVIDGDLGATLGAGFPAWLGGPFAAIDTIGAPAVVQQADQLAAAFGEAFRIPESLRNMAANGGRFYGPSETAGAVALLNIQARE